MSRSTRTAAPAWRKGLRMLRGLVWNGRGGSDEGQALVLVTIAILLLGLIAPVVVSALSGESGLVSDNQNFEAALAAAEAGVQQYKNFLDVNSNYYKYSGTGCPGTKCNDDSDVALDPNGWTSVPSSNPPEAFHYIPNTSYLSSGSSSGSPQVLLTVTGRAGISGHYTYRTIQVVMQSDGLLSNAYYSSYEVLDPAQNPVPVYYTPSGGSPVVDSMNPSAPNAAPGINSESLWSALCGYETWQPNTFIDNLTPPVQDPYTGNNYSSTDPYYGPWRGQQPAQDLSNATNGSITVTYPNGATASISDPCGTIFNFVSGEIFNGPVYTGDQLWVCGNPQFNEGLTSGVPRGFQYAGSNWPTQNGTTSGTNGWIDDGLLDWAAGCGGHSPSNPSFTGTPTNPTGLAQGGNQSLPTTNTLLPQIAQSTGCVYTGPTMIEFVHNTGSITGTMNVWSPLSGNSTGGAGSTYCGTGFSPATPFKTGLPIPSGGLVVYVQNATSSVDPSTVANGLPTGATCMNPWKPWAPGGAACSYGTEGDLVVDGELAGQVTLDAAANIIVSRDLSYQCAVAADGGVSAQQSPTYTLPLPACFPKEPDVLGLVAGSDVVISHPAPGPGGVAGVQVTNSSYTVSVPSRGFPYVQAGMSVIGAGIPSGTTVACYNEPSCRNTHSLTLSAPATASSPSGGETLVFNDDPSVQQLTEPYGWAPTPSSPNCSNDGTQSNPSVAEVEPNCDMYQPVIDAAIIALHGSLADEDWDLGLNDQTTGCLPGSTVPVDCHVWVVGADIGQYRGPFGEGGGCGGLCGYDKAFTFDTRLFYLTPPSLNKVADVLWSTSSFVSCGSVDDAPYTQPAGPNGKTVICPGSSF